MSNTSVSPEANQHDQNGIVAAAGRLVLALRIPILVIFVALTAWLGYSATQVRLDPGFMKMIPVNHPYMKTFLQYSDDYAGANRILVSLKWKGEGDIYNKEFFEILRSASDDVFFIPGVDRAKMASIFTPNVTYLEVTEYGFHGDVVVPAQFSATPEDLAAVSLNVARSGRVGSLVANDLKSAMIYADLQEINPETNEPLDYLDLARQLEDLRQKYESDLVEVNIIGFAKLLGEVIDGLFSVFTFFAVAFFITALLLFAYVRAFRLTLVALFIALMPVLWLLGVLPMLNLGIDPMSILVPFLIFSIGVSHAVQMINAWRTAVAQGATHRDASQQAFCKLFIPGALALLTNALGFAVIMHIDIPIVRELGITACLGVSMMIITNKIMLPVLLSFGRGRANPALAAAVTDNRYWKVLSGIAKPRNAALVLLCVLVILGLGTYQSRGLTVGDIGLGAPELLEDSRYNHDVRAITADYDIGIDMLTVVVENTGFESDACLHYSVMDAIERFEVFMRGVPGVHSVMTVPTASRVAVSASNEGSPRWLALPRDSRSLAAGSHGFNPELGLNTDSCESVQVVMYTDNHDGSTIANIVKEINAYIARTPETPGVTFRLAGGNVGVMAATNEAVEHAELTMLASIFGAIGLLCMLTFRSWRATLGIMVPLALVSILCNALMATLDIGLKVATLPVIALGVGVGVDYGIYLFERIQHYIRHEGRDFQSAFYGAMCDRGGAAVFTAITMSIGVATWAFSALKFQADMGILLAFLFLVNAIAAIVILPALGACFYSESFTATTDNEETADTADTTKT